jgi:chorismate mutase / prephenate dehydratase
MKTIAFLGPEQTNTHVAAQKKFGKASRYLHAATIDDVFHMVERRKADYGVVPIENSLEGAVTHTQDRFIDFLDTPVTIHGEIEQPIKHYLILNRDAKISDIQIVYSHPQALAQCRTWLNQHLPAGRRQETDSTADAVTKLHSSFIHSAVTAPGQTTLIEPKSRAAVGRAELAKDRRLRAIPIPEDRDNKTRFLVLGLGKPKRSTRNKTSILFSVKDKPGALHDALLAFKRERINMTKIESRPSKKKAWEYLFFVDVEGHQSDPRVKRALAALKRSTALLRVLGSYPAASR